MGWVIGIAVLGIGGFAAYKLYKSSQSSPLDSIVNTGESLASKAESILNKDPVSVTSVAKDVYGAGKTVENKISGAVGTFEGWF